MKKVLFTGARSGIAHATIKRIVNKKDYELYVTVHTEKQLELVKETYKNYDNVKCLKVDITNEKDLQQIEALDIDILVNNAAIGVGGSIAEIPMAKVRQCFEVNVFGTFTVVQRVLKRMMQKGEGKIINISSLAGLIPMKFLGVYGASKASVSLLTRTLRKELKIINKNIKIVLIEPGLYKTGFNQVMLENKYDWMRTKSYFSEELKIIKKCENKLFNLLEKRNLNSIAKKIVKAITCDNPCPIYRAPCLYAIFVKLYNFFTN
ncbi:MAG: SDR family NAD(P)-dependent oxidoreductase [Mollicutes bacterium]|jgi:short-subunit dehydrogenase|nr:SDR family NAD(P)-dependent oxidoreductase [Mollicutes bacterium]